MKYSIARNKCEFQEKIWTNIKGILWDKIKLHFASINRDIIEILITVWKPLELFGPWKLITSSEIPWQLTCTCRHILLMQMYERIPHDFGTCHTLTRSKFIQGVKVTLAIWRWLCCKFKGGESFPVQLNQTPSTANRIRITTKNQSQNIIPSRKYKKKWIKKFPGRCKHMSTDDNAARYAD